LLISANLKSQLQQFGYEICGSSTRGETCLEEITELSKQGREPEIVLMDIHLRGDLDGIETAKKINEKFNCAIIFLTGQSSKEVYERSFRIKPFGYLLKPIDMEQTKMTIEIASYQRNIEIENKLYQKDLETLLEKRSHEYKELISMYQTLVENSTMGLTIIQDDRLVFANKQAADFFGYTKEEFLTFSTREIGRHLYPDHHSEVIQKSLERITPENIPPAKKWKVITKNGSIRWLMTFFYTIHYQGRPALNQSFIDITRHQELLDELERCREKMAG
jgi:PAS domain S-box-containing protein